MLGSGAGGKKPIKEAEKLRARKAKLELVSSELTKHKNADEKLYKARADWEKTFDAISDWVAMTDLKGRILRTNRSGEDFTSISSAQIVGQSCCKLVHGSDNHVPGCPLQKMIHTHQRESAELKVPDTNRWLLVTIDPVTDKEGNLVGAVHITRDINNNKKVEEALKRERDFAENLFKTTQAIVLLLDREGRIKHFNPYMEQISGYRLEEVKGKDWFTTFLPKHEQKRIRELFFRASNGIQTRGNVNTIVTKDGCEREVEWYDKILKDANGNVVGLLATGQDITERKKAEEALRESEERYRNLFENAGEGIITLDLDGRITEANRLVEEYGFNRAELIGRQLFEFIPKYDRARSVRDFQALVAGRRVQGQMNVITPKGIITVEYRDTPIVRAGKVIGVQAILTDITERKKAVEVLRESEEKFKSIFEHANDGVIYLDTSGNILDINKKAAQMFGGPKQHVLNKHFTEVGVFTAEEIPTLMSNFEKIFAGEDVVLTVPIKNKKGRELILECSASVAKTDDGAGRIMVIARDITERKKAEEQITRLAKFPAENPYPVLRISGYGMVIYANKASLPLLKVWRCRVGQSLPDPWHELVMDALSSGQSQQTEVQCDGRIFSLTFAPVVDANYVNIYGLDITERKKAEEEIQNLAKFLSENPYPVLRISRGGVVLYANAASNSLLRENNSEIGQPAPQRWQRLVGRVLASDLVERIEEEYKGRIVAFRAVPVTDAGYVNFYGRDITDRKKAQQELIENQAKLKAMASKILMTEERERQSLAMGLHDEVCQKLVLTKLALESSLNLVSDSKVLASLRIACGGIGETIEQADSLTFELSNPVLRQLGFVIALEKYLTEEIRQKHGIEYELEGDEQLGTMHDEIKNCLFRVTRELLTNVVKHAHARKVKVSARESQSQIYVRVQDDGVGFKESQAGSKVSETARFGLFSVREQLEYLGGHLEIESEPGRGTAATVVVPLTKKAIV